MVADRYRVASLLGRGGMGEVYGADDLKLGQRVALKFLPLDRGKSTSWRDQFYAEVRMARQVSHPNVCRVYDVGESNGRLFLSMEFVDGEDLASLLRRIGRLPHDKAVETAQQLCAGMAAAHRSGVLHRDLKPSNVMIDGKGRARITDFGLAIATSEADQQTGPAGTPGYLAPELLDGGAPSIQSDLYALGLVLYELFTGKRAFDASSLADFYRKQTETDPTPPSRVVKNFDPVVERAILRCLDRDPAQRPRSALSFAASLPGGDPLESALAAGETPSPEMVAAAGSQGSLRPAVAWACLVGALILIFGASILLAPRNMDWGLAPLNKSPEVLADRAQDLAQKLGYSLAVDHAFWVASDREYLRYTAHNASSKDWKRTPTGHAWPSPVSFWYRQSPRWMMPGAQSPNGPPRVTLLNPSYEMSGMVALRLDMQGNLLFLRGVPPQVETGGARPDLDWGLLFAEAGLDKAQFVPASAKWAPPDSFDVRADWEGHLPDRPDLLLHVTAAAYHGVPVYFQLIAPWDQPWRGDPSNPSRMPASSDIFTMAWPLLMAGYLVVAGYFARRNLRRGRGDTKGALRLASFAILANCVYGFFGYHYVPQGEYISVQFILLGAPPAFCFARVAGIYGSGALCAAELAEADGFLAASSKRTFSRSTGGTRCVVRPRGWLGSGHRLFGCRGVFAQLGSVSCGQLLRSGDPAVHRPLFPIAFCRILLRSFLFCPLARHDWPVAAAKVRTDRPCTHHAAAECANYHHTGFHFDGPVRARIPGSPG
jgi:serine/threonine-protein kinase